MRNAVLRTDRPSPAFSWLSTGAIALGVVLVGALSLVFSFAVGQTLMLWIPAGFAIYAGAVAPRSALAGVALGSALLAIVAQGLTFPADSEASAILPTLAAVGAGSLRLLLGMWLLPRCGAFPYAPGDARSVGRFTLIGVGVLSVAGALAVTAATIGLGIVGRVDAGPIFVSAWAAQALGIVIFTPIFTFLHGAPRGRRLRSAAPACIAGLLALAAVSAVSTLDARARRTNIAHELDKFGMERAGQVSTALKLTANALDLFSALFEQDGALDRDGFDAAARRLEKAGLGVEAIEWAPLVSRDAREAFETRLGAQAGHPAPIVEWRDGLLTRADARDEFFPVAFTHRSALLGATDGDAPLGFDRGSELSVMAAATLARYRREMIAAVDPRGSRHGKTTFRLIVPVFDAKLGSDDLRGYVIASFSSADALARLPESPENIAFDYWIVDETNPDRPLTLGGGAAPHEFFGPRAAPAVFSFGGSDRRSRTEISFADRKWTVEAAPRRAYLAAEFAPAAYLILIAGVLIASLVCSAPMIFVDRQMRIVAAQEKALADQKFALDQHAIVGIFGVDGRLTYVNDFFCAMSGYPREKLLGRTLALLKSEAHAPSFYRKLGRMIFHGEVWRGEICGRNAEGAPFWVQSAIVPITDQSGRIAQFIAISTDISPLKKLQETVENSEKRLNYALAASSTGLWDYDPRTGRAFFSDTWFTVLGYRPGELPASGATARALSHPDDLPGYLDAFERHGRGEIPQIDVEVRMRRKDGAWAWIRSIGKAIERDAEGAPLRVIGIHRDVTHWREEQTALAEARDAADRANRAKSDFLATMSHEIRTPMNGVIGMASLLEDSALDEQQKHYVETIRQSGEELLGLIDDILDFSKLEAGKLILERRPFSPVALVENILRLLEPLAARKQLRLRFEPVGAPPALALGDAARLRQILLNLTGNAIKFTEKGSVALRLSCPSPHRLRFEVDDTGIGVPAEHRDLLFHAFSQADPSITRKYGGAGLGLAICKRLVDAMGGEIGFESKPDGGSLFWFETEVGLGQTAPDATRSAAPRPSTETPQRRPLDVLIIEDTATNREVLGGLLRRLGHRVDAAENGVEGLARATAHDYDLVFMDVHMPEMDGLEATRRLRAKAPGPRPAIVAMTASAFPSDISACLAAGMDDFVAKPIDRRKLADVLARLTGDQGPNHGAA